jgi:hypothetical protein
VSEGRVVGRRGPYAPVAGCRVLRKRRVRQWMRMVFVGRREWCSSVSGWGVASVGRRLSIGR